MRTAARSTSLAIAFVLAMVPAAASAKSLLWEVAAKGKRSYLLGSIHLARKDLYPLPEVVEKAFKETDGLVLEARPDPTPELVKYTMEKGMYVPPDGLAKHVKPATLSAVKAKLKRMGLPAAQFLAMRPWLLAVTLTVMDLASWGYDPNLGIDKHFYERAKKGKHPVEELEGAMFQYHLLSDFSDSEQELFLHYSLAESKVMKAEMAQIVDQWKNGSAEGLHRALTAVLRKYPDFKPIYKKVMTDRNYRMVKRIKGLLASGRTYLIVVGAGHMVGSEGIVSLLRKSGYKVRQL